MGQLVELPVGVNGDSIVVEASLDHIEQGVVRAASPGEVVAKAGETLEGALDRIGPAAATLVGAVRNHLPQGPADVQLQFGLKVATKAGLVIASGTAEANFQVTIKWSRE